MKRKICVVTGTRAEYGLMFWILKLLKEDREVDLQIIITGMHLSPEFGLTYANIEKDGFHINRKIEILLSSDSEVAISKSMGLAQISFAEAFEQLEPDILVILGDRFEAFSVTAAAMVLKIPVAHLHGGETTEGVIDESIRHSITKMSHLHFTSTEAYRKRVVQMGEHPARVFNVGAPGLDSINRLKLLNKREFQESINFKLNKYNILVTFHPVTLENNTAGEQFEELLSAIDELEDTNFIFTKPNADANGRVIIHLIDNYVSKNSQKACAFKSLGHPRYLSALEHVDIVLGNSSSGIIEAPSFRKATVNIGERQKGRIMAKSVINCSPDKKSIQEAMKIAYSENFQKELRRIKNPYGQGGASEKIVSILKSQDLSNILKKEFMDIEFKVDDKKNR